jgi:glycosyltransferase involved in cell wall biosynthesis
MKPNGGKTPKSSMVEDDGWGAVSPDALCELTILMPCLNEAATVGDCVRQAVGYLKRCGIAGEVLVADNGSDDDSAAVAAANGARVVPASIPGYGGALMAGIAAARGTYVIMGDADASYDFSDLDGFLERLRRGNDLVMGNRFTGGIATGAMPPLHRFLGNPVLSGVGRLFFKSPVGDFHCGLRGFRREAVLAMGLTTTGMEFASEMVVKATLQKLRIAEVPTTLSVDGRRRDSHLRSWRDGWRHLRFLLLFSPRWLFFYPGVALMLLGLASMLWLLPGPRRVGGIGLDVNTLVYSGAAVICGFQAVMFALFAKVFAVNAGLLPEDRRLSRLAALLRLETGLAAGLCLLVGGLAASFYAVGFWGAFAFGPIDPRVSLRIVAPAVTAMVLGVQMVFAGFFLGVLGLKRR